MTSVDQLAARYLETIGEEDPEFLRFRQEVREEHPELSEQQVTLLTWTWLHLAAKGLFAAAEAANPGSTRVQ